MTCMNNVTKVLKSVIDKSEHLYTGDTTVWKDLLLVEYIKLFACVVIIIGGLLGNLGVILIVALNKSMRTTINIYVANLAVADAMICIFCMVPQAINVMTKDVYVLGEFMCKFNSFTQMACLTSSVLTLSAISCDRFMAVIFPLRSRITKQRNFLVMTVIWLISFLVSVPFLIFKKHILIKWKNFTDAKCAEQWPIFRYYDESTQKCESYQHLRILYYVIVSVILFFLPFVIMVNAYSLILWKISVSEVPGEHTQANANIQSRARKKVIQMVFCVLVAFILCWTPLIVIVLYSAFGHDLKSRAALSSWFADFKWFAYYIAYANSFINPIIYGGFNRSFRDGFCILFRCCRSGENYGRSRSRIEKDSYAPNLFLRSFQSMSTTLSSLKNRTYRFFSRVDTRVSTVKATPEIPNDV